MHKFTLALMIWLGLCLQAQADVFVRVTYLEERVQRPPTLSNLDDPPLDTGRAGAELALAENLTTGKFLKHGYTLDSVVTDIGGDFLGAARAALESGARLLVVNATADGLLALADLPEAQDAILFNASAPDMALRDTDCRANVLHTLPSRGMLTDALAQFLVMRRLQDAALISGDHPQDHAYADALRHSLTKFGIRLRGEKTWAFNADMRRNAAQEVPLFTQDFSDHDVLLIADELGDFGRYIAYNTWLPRPVAGSEGLTPAAWSPVVEQWGAEQLQNRFMDHSGRAMGPVDYAAWAAVRAIGEAATRTNSDDPATLRSYMLSDSFSLAAFKGRKLSFRSWNGQLRQPIPLVQPRALVAQAPLDGFLHRVNELDTLGLDRPESRCTAFQEN